MCARPRPREQRPEQQHRAAQPADQRAVGRVRAARAASRIAQRRACRCPRPRRRGRAAAAPSPRRRRCAARWSARTPPRSAGTPPAAAAPRSCCLRRPRGLRAGGRLQSAVWTSGARFLQELDVPRFVIEADERPARAAATRRTRSSTARLTRAANRDHIARRRAAAIDDRERVLRREPDRPFAVPLRTPARSISQAAGIFTRPSADGKARYRIAGVDGHAFAIVAA